MGNFSSENFLLNNTYAIDLYNKGAKDMPIFDYHCHLSAKDIVEDRPLRNLTELWLEHDHYKWRLMRAAGVDESYITGGRSDYEKFEKWAEVISKAIGNPIYQWCHMELRAYFSIDKVISPATAKEIWEEVNGKIESEQLSAKKFIRRSNVKFIGTTDDPADDLSAHRVLLEDASWDVEVSPTFRPDRFLYVLKKDFIPAIGELEKVIEKKISSFNDLKAALEERMDYFMEVGCVISDHSLERFEFESGTEEQCETIYAKALKGEAITEREAVIFRSNLLTCLGQSYSARGWIVQLHLGALRNVNQAQFEKLGRDSGIDGIEDVSTIEALSQLLNSIQAKGSLPKVVFYSLNPKDNAALSVLVGCFQDGTAVGKMQLGSAWWFNDHKKGIEDQITAFANAGVLGTFIGMLTDSRSFSSYVRHDYFRRILCNVIGQWVENGEIPFDEDNLVKIVSDISYNNSKNYFTR